MLTVQKFGGSSLADAEKIHRCAEICRREKEKGRDVAMVVSAMGDTTDELLALAYTVSAAPSARELDALLSTGECVSAALAAIALESMGCPARSLSGWQSGVFTDAVHGSARIETLTAARIRSLLAQGTIPVITGYQGIDSFGDVTTLGRGGSDTTAVALAAALCADNCDIYTDVAGVYTADPRLVPEARPLETIDVRDMLRLSYSGAQVLHASSLELALERSVDLRVREVSGSCADLSGSEGGTSVRVLQEKDRKPLAGLALEGGTVTLVGRDACAGFERVLSGLRENGIRVLHSACLRDSVSVEVERDDALRALRALHKILFE